MNRGSLALMIVFPGLAWAQATYVTPAPLPSLLPSGEQVCNCVCPACPAAVVNYPPPQAVTHSAREQLPGQAPEQPSRSTPLPGPATRAEPRGVPSGGPVEVAPGISVLEFPEEFPRRAS